MLGFIFPALTSNQKIKRHLEREPINHAAHWRVISAFRYANYCVIMQNAGVWFSDRFELTPEEWQMWEDRRILAIVEAQAWRHYE